MIGDNRKYLYTQRASEGEGRSDPRQLYDQRIAKAAVKEVFALLGVDVDDPEKVEEFRKDLRFGGAMRRATDKGISSIVGVAAAMMVTALGMGLVALISANSKGGGG